MPDDYILESNHDTSLLVHLKSVDPDIVVPVALSGEALSVELGESIVLGAGTAEIGKVAGLIERQTLVKKTVDFTAGQTAQTLWDPTSGKKFVVVQAIVSFSGAGALTVFDETDDAANRVFKLNGAANGGMAVAFTIPVVSATADNLLKYTTGAGAVGSLTVFGYEV